MFEGRPIGITSEIFLVDRLTQMVDGRKSPEVAIVLI
jgi:hypothetical protein